MNDTNPPQEAVLAYLNDAEFHAKITRARMILGLDKSAIETVIAAVWGIDFRVAGPDDIILHREPCDCDGADTGDDR